MGQALISLFVVLYSQVCLQLQCQGCRWSEGGVAAVRTRCPRSLLLLTRDTIILLQMLIISGTLMFVTFLFGLIFNNTTQAYASTEVSLALDIYLRRCLLNQSLNSERVRSQSLAAP